MRIQHNIMAMNAYRNYTNNTSALSKNLEKLSSGYKINRAGDDAAGLAISEKMRAQITGLATAQKNAKDGISLIQTAEGALTEVHDMLNRMVELADQSANGTYDDGVDRANLQKEFDALRDEIDRISKATNFNGINLLDGTQAQSGVANALGDIMTELSVDGVKGGAATKAELSVTLGNNTPVTLSAVASVNGTTASAAVTGSISFTAVTGGNISGVAVNTGTGQLLLDLTLSDGRKVGDLFEFGGGGTVTAGSVVTGGEIVELVSKSGGRIEQSVLDEVKTLLSDGGGAGALTVNEGLNVGEGGSATKTKYELSFTVSGAPGDTIAGNQSFEIGGKKFILSTDGQTDDPDATYIKFSENDVDTADGQTAIKNKIQEAIKDAFGSEFTVDAKIDGNDIKVTMEATNPGRGSNDGAGFIVAGSGNNAISIAFTPGDEAQGGASGSEAKVEYNFDLNDLKVGSELAIGGKTMTVVADGENIEPGKITLSDARDGKKLAQAFEGAGFTAANISFENGKLTISAKKDGDQLAALQGMNVTFREGASELENGISGMKIELGTTSLGDIKNATVGGQKISDLFDIKVNGQVVGDSTVLNATHEITFTAKKGGALSDEVMNAIMGYAKSGAEVSGNNGTDAGASAGVADRATYTMSVDATKLESGQQFEIGGKKFQLTNGGEAKEGYIAINIGDKDPAGALKAIQGAVRGALGTDYAVKAKPDGNKLNLTLTAMTAGIDGNKGEFRVANDTKGAISGTYTAADTVPEAGKTGAFAQVSYAFDTSKLQAGDTLTIGDTSLTVVADDAAKLEENQIRLSDARDGDKLAKTFEAKGYNSGRTEFADGKLTITDKTEGRKAEALLADKGKVTLTSSTRDLSAMEGGLTLQIGDTSDEYNQLTVNVDAMNCASLGIDNAKINIGDQTGAQGAVAVLKEAINKVSSTRGGLGALQNRLEHTINNLSVMTENIQDAESSIRDVDVAEEMMAYTKNNILVQSAQAMLAQANQLPQGVLQLLQ